MIDMLLLWILTLSFTSSLSYSINNVYKGSLWHPIIFNIPTVTYFHFKSAIKAKWSDGKYTDGRATNSVTSSCEGNGITLDTLK